MRKLNDFTMGDFNRICDRTGFKVKASDTKREWNHLIVRTKSWEERHPQDFIRGIRDVQAVNDPRPGAQDSLVYTETTLDADELPGQTTLSVTATTSMTVGDAVMLVQDNDELHMSNIASIVAGDTVTIDDATTYLASSGNVLYIASAVVAESSL